MPDAPKEVAVNEKTGYVYVTTQGGELWIVDGRSNSVLRTIAVASPEGVAVDEVTGRVYVASTGPSNLEVYNGSSGEPVRTIGLGAGSDPYGVAADPSTRHMFVAGTGGNIVYDVDESTNQVVTWVGVGKAPQLVAVDPVAALVYVTNTVDNTVSVINEKTDSVATTWSAPPIVNTVNPGGLAVNPSTHHIFVGTGTDVSVFDGQTNALLETISFPHREIAGIATNATTNRAYVVLEGEPGYVAVIQDR